VQNWWERSSPKNKNTALTVREFLATKQITVLEHPAYSQDLPPTPTPATQRILSVPEDKENIERKVF
jgi:hypothetical protein